MGLFDGGASGAGDWLKQLLARQQGIGAGIDQAVANDPYAGQRPEHGGLRGLLDKGVNALGGSDRLKEIGAILMAGDGNPSVLNYLARQQGDRADHDLSLQLEDRRDARQQRQRDVFGDAEHGYNAIDGTGAITNLLPGAGPTPTQRMRDFQDYKGMSPEDRALYDRSGLLGGNSEYAYGQRRQLKGMAPGKAPGAGGAPRYEYQMINGQYMRRRVQ